MSSGYRMEGQQSHWILKQVSDANAPCLDVVLRIMLKLVSLFAGGQS